jgi:adenine phosphoribosyltransferase
MTAAESDSETPSVAERLAATLRVVPDFPAPGIRFQDITPVLADAELFAAIVDAMAALWRNEGITHVAGVESRGFILAAPIALTLGAGLITVRKPGKLPWRTVVREYALEYGSGVLEIHEDACPPGARVLLVDDVLATGGTAAASCGLLEAIGAEIVGCGFLLAIEALGGSALLEERRVRVLLAR